MGVPDREARDDSYDYLTRVPERGAREHEIQRQDERYIEAAAQPIIFPLSNEYSPVYILVTLRVTLIVARLYSYSFTCGRYSPPRHLSTPITEGWTTRWRSPHTDLIQSHLPQGFERMRLACAGHPHY